jgi:LPXTG-motif cell wall-anchored protein
MLGGMKYLIAAILIAAGAYLIDYGHRRADSIAGIAEKTGKDIANAFDGRTRQPDHLYYYVGGGALIAGGAWVALRKRKV